MFAQSPSASSSTATFSSRKLPMRPVDLLSFAERKLQNQLANPSKKDRGVHSLLLQTMFISDLTQRNAQERMQQKRGRRSEPVEVPEKKKTKENVGEADATSSSTEDEPMDHS